jgi:hypothetical protein
MEASTLPSVQYRAPKVFPEAIVRCFINPSQELHFLMSVGPGVVIRKLSMKWCVDTTYHDSHRITNNVRIIYLWQPHPLKMQYAPYGLSLGITQQETADSVHVTLRAWQMWEAGQRKMPAGIWELCVIKAGLHPLYVVKNSAGANTPN